MYKDKIALIPGASRPVGRAIAHAFGRVGMHLVLPFIEDWPESHEEMIEDFNTHGYSFFSHPCDLTDPAQVKNLSSLVRSKFGKLHFLINNIERGGMPIVHGSYKLPVNEQQWQLEFDTTLRAKFDLYQASMPLILESGGGSVTNISSIAGLIGRSGPGSLLFSDGYSCANRGITSLTETWAREAGPLVRVNEVMIGLVEGRHGEKTRGWSLLSRDQRQELLDHTLLKRTAQPSEIADVVFYIATAASYITGSRIIADGGYHLAGDHVSVLPPGDLSQP